MRGIEAVMTQINALLRSVAEEEIIPQMGDLIKAPGHCQKKMFLFGDKGVAT